MSSAKSEKGASEESMKDSPGSAKWDPIGDIMHGVPVPTLDVSPVGVSMSLAIEAHLNM